MIITVDDIRYYLHHQGEGEVWINSFDDPVISLSYRWYRVDDEGNPYHEPLISLGVLHVCYCTEKETLKQAVESAIRDLTQPDEQEMFDDES